MKITKNRLRQIIQEELVQVLNEQARDPRSKFRMRDLNPFSSDDPDPFIADPDLAAQGGPAEYDAVGRPHGSPTERAVHKAQMAQTAGLQQQAGGRKAKVVDPSRGFGADNQPGLGGDWCNPKLSRSQVLNVLRSNNLYTGPKWYKSLPYNHPARVKFREWNRCAGGKPHSPDPKDTTDPEGTEGAEAEVTEGVCENEDVMHDTYAMYNALKGWNTDEEMVYQVLERNSNCACMKELYANFDKLLEMKDDTDAGDLIDWLRDDGEYKAAAMVKKCMMGTDVRQIDTEWR